MNAIVFIQQYGIEKARKVVAAYHGIPSYTFKEKTGRGYSACQSVDLSELKRLVESVDLVKEHYTLDRAKIYAASPYTAPEIKERLEQAIADYEQLFGNTETLELETLRDCDTSPNCKKYDERMK